MIEDRVREIIVDKLNINEDRVTDDAHFVDDLGTDSLDQVELIMAFEEEFDITIPADEVEKMDTFGNLVKYLEEKLSSQGA